VLTCRGTLFLTDLRMIFIPSDVQGPSWMDNMMTQDMKINGNLSSEQVILIRKLTIQIPISALQDVRYHAENLNSTVMIFEARDGSSIEFKIRRHISNRRMIMENSAMPVSSPHQHRATSVANAPEFSIIIDKARLSSPLYRSGLDTEDILPQLWCARIVDEIQWRIREDMIWILWTRYVKETVEKAYPTAEAAWLKNSRQVIDFEAEYQRLRIQDSNWILSDMNRSYGLCSTYPQCVVVPGILTDTDVYECSMHRSRERIPSLVWLHPTSKAPLCRSAQPMAGMSGSSNEADRKFCIAIKTSCPRGFPLRIADARPRLNANANAIQGKGFENISFLGGPKMASLVFLDVENIHVVRASYIKIKEGLMLPGMSSGSDTNNDVIASSKWLVHIAGLLRGASGIAESLIMGHPVLLHCSDGWDRTGQLSALSQVMLDPYYRSIHGFLVLVNKEFCGFGYRFESRHGKMISNSKESSPIFFQFLDAMYQLISQYPTQFEYTGYFLQMFAQAVYSGYFSSFRGNCERERRTYIRHVSHNENLSFADAEYSTIFCYVGILLRCPSTARLMVNAYYSQPTIHMNSSTASIFLRPKSSVNDMTVWRAGIFGYVPDIATHYAAYTPTETECLAIQSQTYSRWLSYLEIQSRHQDSNYIARVEMILHHDSYYNQPATSTPYQQVWDPTSLSFRKQHAKLAIGQNINVDSSISRKHISMSAKIVIWYRAEKALASSWPTLQEMKDKSQNIRVLMKKIYRALLQSEYRLKMKLRWMSARLTSLWIHSIVDDIVEETLVRCLRTDSVINPSEALDSAYAMVLSSSQSSMTSSGVKMDPIGAAKSISNKIRSLQWSSSKDRSISPSPGYSHSTVTEQSFDENDLAHIERSSSDDRLYRSEMTEDEEQVIVNVLSSEVQTPTSSSPRSIPFDPLSGILEESSSAKGKTVIKRSRSGENQSPEKTSFAGKVMNMIIKS
jgi:hypothetical protein